MPRKYRLAMIIAGMSSFAIISSIVNFYVLRNYMVYAEVSCNPDTHSCFIGDGVISPDFYSKVHKKAFLIESCDQWAGNCRELSCSLNDGAKCSQEYCSGIEGTTCSRSGR